MSDDLPVRGARVRRRPTRRSSRAFSPRRAMAALAMLGAAGLVWGAVGSSAFAIREVEVEGADLTGEAEVRAALALVDGAPSAFAVATDALRERVLLLPAIEDADVRVGLPGTLHVRVEEREAVLAWRLEGALLLVDRAGRVIADAAAPGAAAAAAAARDLPTIVDRRSAAAGLAIGGDIDPLELDVATRLLSLTPADIGSAAPGIQVTVDDDDGWAVTPAVDEPWVAVFGFYGLEIRPPAMIPEQVRLLRTLLLGQGEATVLRAILAGERAGTFVERSAP